MVELRANEKAATKDNHGEALPTFESHIYSDADGKFPAQLNELEGKVVATEISRPSFVAWYRNPQRASPNSIRIPYQDEAGKWSSLQIDFLIVSRRDDGTLAASVVDPHGDYWLMQKPRCGLSLTSPTVMEIGLYAFSLLPKRQMGRCEFSICLTPTFGKRSGDSRGEKSQPFTRAKSRHRTSRKPRIARASDVWRLC